MNLGYVVDNLCEASMKVGCPVEDLQILFHLFQQVSVQQKLYAMGNVKE